MKTLKLLTVILIAALNFNCSKDDDGDFNRPTPSQAPLAPVSLTFDLQTNQDQMGDFANNSMAIFNGKVWSFGGSNDYITEGDSTDELWNSTNGVNWASTDTEGTLTAVGRHDHTLTVFNDKMYLIGGDDNDDNILSDIWVTDDGIHWSNIEVTAPFGQVAGHSAIVFNGRMYVIGINYTSGSTKVWSTGNGVDWTEETSSAFPGLKRYKAIVMNNAIYVIGGDKVTSVLSNEIWRSSNGIDWTLVTQTDGTLPAIKRHTVTVYNNKAWVVGGATGSSEFTNDIYYSSDLSTWQQYDGLSSIEAINSHCSLAYNGALWVFGGGGASGRTGKIWRICED